MYGFTTVVVQAQPPFETVDPVEILAGSACQVIATYYDFTQTNFVPSAVAYQVSDVASGTVIAAYETLTPTLSNEVVITAAQNAILSALPNETHVVTFKITDTDGNVYLQEALFTLRKVI